MTDMTPEQLDAWRAKQAMNETCRSLLGHTTLNIATIAARLAREDVRPTDPDVLAVREICALDADDNDCCDIGALFRDGRFDNGPDIRRCLAAYRAGREAGR